MKLNYDVTWRCKQPQARGREEEIIDMYVNQQLTIRTISEIIGCSYGSANDILIKNKVEKRTFKEVKSTKDGLKNVKPRRLVDPLERKECIGLYLSGATLTDLGEKYGVSAVGLRKILKKYDIPLRSAKESGALPTTNERKKATCFSNYGVDNPMQDPTIYQTSNINRYKFKAEDIHGRRFSHLQGYEPQGIVYLIEQMGISVNSIESGRKVPKIYYKFGNKNKIYYPDMYVADKNLLVEIKCDYTYNNQLDLNTSKREASIKSGYDHITIIFDNLGKRVTQII
jgi:transposase